MGGTGIRSRRRGLVTLGLLVGLGGVARGEVLAAEAPLFFSVEGGFSARFPETPRYEDVRKRTLLGGLRTRGWEVERGAFFVRVARHDVPALAPVALGADVLLDRSTRDLLDDVDAREPRSEPASHRGYPGRHLRYERGDRPGEVEEAWLYLLGKRLYVIFARGGDRETSAAAARFAASVELLEE